MIIDRYFCGPLHVYYAFSPIRSRHWSSLSHANDIPTQNSDEQSFNIMPLKCLMEYGQECMIKDRACMLPLFGMPSGHARTAFYASLISLRPHVISYDSAPILVANIASFSIMPPSRLAQCGLDICFMPCMTCKSSCRICSNGCLSRDNKSKLESLVMLSPRDPLMLPGSLHAAIDSLTSTVACNFAKAMNDEERPLLIDATTYLVKASAKPDPKTQYFIELNSPPPLYLSADFRDASSSDIRDKSMVTQRIPFLIFQYLPMSNQARIQKNIGEYRQVSPIFSNSKNQDSSFHQGSSFDAFFVEDPTRIHFFQSLQIIPLLESSLHLLFSMLGAGRLIEYDPQGSSATAMTFGIFTYRETIRKESGDKFLLLWTT
ncbi:hypothetical protein VNO77_04037 [Canavalia gladiata]|uniref:Uncharacterized protein n=1 Tax=Canavalia gladiata TaxID=3824 RepID=A0AAN9R7E3_CANGL